MTIPMLAIVNGDPGLNAGARLRIQNWSAALPSTSKLRPTIIWRPKRFGELFRLVRDWIKTEATPDPGRESPSIGSVVIIQKAFSLEMVTLLIYLRLIGVTVIQDICDPPIKVFNPQPFSKSFFAVIYLSLISHYLIDHITVSSSVLERSFSANPCGVTYITDCIDPLAEYNPEEILRPALHIPALDLSSDHHDLPGLRLLWFGGAARVNSHAGIEELYANQNILSTLGQAYRIHLDICTTLEDDNLDAFRSWASSCGFVSLTYYPWSLTTQAALLKACDFCILPRLQSLGTFYKSPNRVVLAARFDTRTLANTIASDDYEDLNIMLPDELLAAAKGAGLPSRYSEGRSPFPTTWTTPWICRLWENTISTACQAHIRRPLPKLTERMLLVTCLSLLMAVLLLPELLPCTKRSRRRRKAKRTQPA